MIVLFVLQKPILYLAIYLLRFFISYGGQEVQNTTAKNALKQKINANAKEETRAFN